MDRSRGGREDPGVLQARAERLPQLPRPCGYATEFVDRKGKVRKRYDAYLTPYEKLKSLPQAEQYLRPGVTMAELERIAQSHSDTEYALLVQQERAKLLRSFAPRAVSTLIMLIFG